jgi:hypothetical protein
MVVAFESIDALLLEETLQLKVLQKCLFSADVLFCD